MYLGSERERVRHTPQHHHRPEEDNAPADTTPSDLFVPVRLHLLKFLEPPKVALLAGDQMFNSEAFLGGGEGTPYNQTITLKVSNHCHIYCS